MKTTLATVFSVLFLGACSGPVDPPEPPVGPEPIEIPIVPNDGANVHTMLLVGTNELFISHLPLYDFREHAYQIIMKVELDAASQADLIADQQATGAALYTFFPPAFNMTFLADALRAGDTFPLEGSQIARGHIERGGIPIINNASFTVTEALHFRVIDPNDQDPAESKYLLFGANGENFVAHLIAGRPDFDQFMEVTAPAGVVVDFVAQEFTVPGQSSATPLNEGQVINTTLFGEDIQLTTGTEHYLEFGDLQ